MNLKKLYLIIFLGLILVITSTKGDHNSTRFVKCTSKECKDKGEAGLYTKVVLSRIKDSKAAIVWLQGGWGRVNGLDYGPIDKLSRNLTTVGVDVGYDLKKWKTMPSGNNAEYERWSADYVARVKSVVMWTREEFGLPVFIMGHSAGGSGVSGYLLMEEENQTMVSGAIWSASNREAPYPGKTKGLAVKQLNLPALIIHHEKDPCSSTLFFESEKRYKKYTEGGMNLGPTQLIKITGGEKKWNPKAKTKKDFCSIDTGAHGYVGVEDEFTEQVMQFIQKYSNISK